jgi:hypothetical protein
MSAIRQFLTAATENRRAYTRTALSLPGQIYLPAEETAVRCTVTDVSGGGVRLICEDVPPVSTFVILTIEGFGRFNAVTTRFTAGALGLKFVCAETRRAKLLRQIDAFLEKGVSGAAICGVAEDN